MVEDGQMKLVPSFPEEETSPTIRKLSMTTTEVKFHIFQDSFLEDKHQWPTEMKYYVDVVSDRN